MRRKPDGAWLDFDKALFFEGSVVVAWTAGYLAEDCWEAEPKAVEVTYEKFWDAAAKTLKIEHRGLMIHCNTEDMLLASRLQDFARALGLEPS